MKRGTGDTKRRLEGIITDLILSISKNVLKVRLIYLILERENISKK